MLHAAVAMFALLLPGVQDPQPLLTPAEQKELGKRLAKMVSALEAYDTATGRKRDGAAKDYREAKDGWEKEWERQKEKKGDLTRSIADMQAICRGIVVYPGRPGNDSLSVIGAKEKEGTPEHALSVPKAYKAEQAMRCVVQIPGRISEKDGWLKVRDWFNKTYDGSPMVKDTIFHVVSIDKDMFLDDFPDYSKENAYDNEAARIRAVYSSLGPTWKTYNIDKNHTYLDCGRDACAFGLRLAAHFPTRFAGLVLREPKEAAELRLGSLYGTKVLLLSTAATKAACEKLKARFEQQEPGSCTILETTDEYPHPGATTEIEKWMQTCNRSLMRPKVILEPNDDRFAQGSWVSIKQMDSIYSLPAAERPRIEVTADRATNRINVVARGVENFELMLNDNLVDLDKEFVVVVNDKAFPAKLPRSFTVMLDGLRRKADGDYLFSVLHSCAVPKQDKPKNDKPSDDKPADGNK